MKNLKKTTRRKKIAPDEKKGPATRSRAKTQAKPTDETSTPQTRATPGTANATSVAQAKVASPPAAGDDFSAGIFDVEERLFEPMTSPAVLMVEPTAAELRSELIVVDESIREDDAIKSDDPMETPEVDDSRSTSTDKALRGDSVTTEPATDGQTGDDAEPPARGRRRSRGRRRGRKPAEGETEAAPVRPEAKSSKPPTRGRRGRRDRNDADAEHSATEELIETGDSVAPWDDEITVLQNDEAADSQDVVDVDDDEVQDLPRAQPEDSSRREMLINVSDPDEVRIALMRDSRLDELYIERASSVSNVGNIYKGRVTNVESSIQAAFVDFGKTVQGFLHISDLHPNYFPQSKGEPELVGRKTPRRQRPPIQNCLKRGQEVVVQVIKEGVGTKGPTLTTYISLPGRFLVMMPGMEQLGVSRKVEDEEIRRKVRGVLGQLSLPKDYGFIVRTAGIDRSKQDLQRDLNYLTRLWDKVQTRMKNEPAPATLYKESDLVIRTIRDVYDSNFHRIIVDNPTVAQRVREFLDIASPQAQDVVELYDKNEPLYHRYGIESEIDKLYSKHVPLLCGGSLVIEQTEALVAIDVNSGRFRVHDNPEETAYRVNLEAADEIARQLRLRDLGGLIVCDLIDMTLEKHKRAVERRLSEALRNHKERAKLLRISRFGILEMTRQRQRPSFAKSMFVECPRCSGSGRVMAPETVSLNVMRDIRLASHREGVASVDVTVSAPVGNDLLNRKRHQLVDLERSQGIVIRIHPDPMLSVDEIKISCVDRRGREVPTGGNADTSARGSHESTGAGSTGRPPSSRSSAEMPARSDGKRGGGRRRRGRGR